MHRFLPIIVTTGLLFVHHPAAISAPPVGDLGDRYVLVNVRESELRPNSLQNFAALKGSDPTAPRLGVGIIISYLRHPPEENLALLRKTLELCETQRLAVIVQLDGEQWWGARPDLWNWWDNNRRGYNPANVENVEWSGWGPEHALKIAWRNWGQQLRVLPPPNLMSPRYRAACHAEMRPLVDEIVRWRYALPEDKRWLLVGVKVGWESAIGMGSHYFPNGNTLLGEDPANDPHIKARPNILPGRGFQPIGYAAVATAGLAKAGELQEAHLAEVIRRHLADLSAEVRRAGLPRELIFTHCGGWAEGERLYRAAVNDDSCPGWSFYRHGRDPRGDKTAMAALATSSAPHWGAVEWLPIGAKTADDWRTALRTTLATDRCRYVCIYNWRQIKNDATALEGIRRALAEPPLQPKNN